ncbi:class I SAM-dependent methyltransferase [Mycolicibacterium llatzerense]|uniref:class I SAM-dependent methyltransferase n=1 Tax=Mycolicibacterium llatzerense TaxID=280871 RepID=UPI0021B6E445|nr:class I SAM-dependent methyltransferase [Mycolicibacterium llatzerense]MCT7362085.1 hypothetical protein [Mycolicibacterium llatzerense]
MKPATTTRAVWRLIDVILVPVATLSALIMRAIRRRGLHRLPATRATFRRVGVFPLLDHYYEPLFTPTALRVPLSAERDLPALDMNIDEQLLLLEKFDYADELLAFPQEEQAGLGFYFQNSMFSSGDAEYLYNIIRLFKPRRIIEIGSGQSTRIAAAAIAANLRENDGNACRHVCVEPYEADWLEQLDVTVLRTPVEQLDKSMFDELESNDVLFIDSSHMIRPQGDVLHEYLELLPRLNSGVLVHVHDIFTPRDYPAEWIIDQNRFWNEQYLLEAFLSYNSAFKVIGALNFLKHHYPEQLSRCCPVLGAEITTREPGSFWMQRV